MTDRPRAAEPIPVVAWVLVAAAVAQAVLWAALNWYRLLGGPYLILRLEDASSVITGMAPFLLGAAVLMGVPRWPAGRGWLYAGAGLFALSGVLRSATDAWAWWMTDPVGPEGATRAALVAASLITATVAALAPACLSLGLVRSRPSRPVFALAALVPLAVGAVAMAGGLALLGRELAAASDVARGEPAIIAFALVYWLLTTLGPLAFVALAVAAVQTRPPAGMAPEVLIAIGATLAAAGSAASMVGQSLLSFEAQGEHLLWVFTLPSTASSIGMLLLIAGFGVAALRSGRTSA